MALSGSPAVVELGRSNSVLDVKDPDGWLADRPQDGMSLIHPRESELVLARLERAWRRPGSAETGLVRVRSAGQRWRVAWAQARVSRSKTPACRVKLLPLVSSDTPTADSVEASVERSAQSVLDEVHDRVAQTLVLAQLRSRALTRMVEGSEVAEPAAQLDALVSRCLNEVRELLHATGQDEAQDPPTLLERLRLAAVSVESDYGVRVSVRGVDAAAGVPGPWKISDVLVRAAREFVINAAKHGAASRASVALQARGGKVVLSVRDNGLGPAGSSEALGTGYGLSSLRRAAGELGGEVRLRAGRSRGVVASCVLPLTESERGREA